MEPLSRKSNKISDIVRLQQILKKWKKVANANLKNSSSSSNLADVAAAATNSTSGSSSGGGNKSIKFLKKTPNSNVKKSSSSSNLADVAAANSTSGSGGGGNKSLKFLKKTLSFSESSSSSMGTGAVPKGYVAVCVGKEERRFVIPTEHLSQQVFGVLLREAEEEFGFQQQGVLKLPCEVEVFEKILKMMEVDKNTTLPEAFSLLDRGQDEFASDCTACPSLTVPANSCSPDTGLTAVAHRQHLSQSQLCK